MEEDLAKWVLCPRCRNKTRTKILQETVAENLPVFCPKCKSNFLVEIKQLKIRILKEPDADK